MAKKTKNAPVVTVEPTDTELAALIADEAQETTETNLPEADETTLAELADDLGETDTETENEPENGQMQALTPGTETPTKRKYTKRNDGPRMVTKTLPQRINELEAELAMLTDETKRNERIAQVTANLGAMRRALVEREKAEREKVAKQETKSVDVLKTAAIAGSHIVNKLDRTHRAQLAAQALGITVEAALAMMQEETAS